MAQPQEKHNPIWGSGDKWWVQRTPVSDISGPWATKEAAEAVLRGDFWEAHRLEREAKGIRMESL